MFYRTQREKEDAIYDRVDAYVRQGEKKSIAVRMVMAEYCYSTESAIYGILKRVKKRKLENGE